MTEKEPQSILTPEVLSQLTEQLLQKFSAEQRNQLEVFQKNTANISFSTYAEQTNTIGKLEEGNLTMDNSGHTDKAEIDVSISNQIGALAQSIIENHSLTDEKQVTLDTSGLDSIQIRVCEAIVKKLTEQGILANAEAVSAQVTHLATEKMLMDENLSATLQNFLSGLPLEEVLKELEDFITSRPGEEVDFDENHYWVNLGLLDLEDLLRSNVSEIIKTVINTVGNQQEVIQAQTQLAANGHPTLNEKEFRTAYLGMVSNFMRALFYLVAKGETNIDKFSPPVRQKAVAAMVQVMNQ